jgi:hypothetical protein
MYGLGPVPFKDDCAVASMDMSTEYEVILLTSEGTMGQSRLRTKSPIAKKSEAKSGNPHLAKNQRDMGHPGSFLGAMKKGPQGLKALKFCGNV